MVNTKERVTTEYLECPGGVRRPFVARSDYARESIALLNKACLAHGWLDATQDEINDALTTGGPNGDSVWGLKWIH
jgi:hypothetical protein